VVGVKYFWRHIVMSRYYFCFRFRRARSLRYPLLLAELSTREISLGYETAAARWPRAGDVAHGTAGSRAVSLALGPYVEPPCSSAS